MLQASQQQIQAAQNLAVNVAAAATEKAVQSALQSLSEPCNTHLGPRGPQESATREAPATLATPAGHTTIDYKSDFETYTTTFEPDRFVHPCVCSVFIATKVIFSSYFTKGVLFG